MRIFAFFVTVFIVLSAAPSHAQQKAAPLFMQADNVAYDTDKSLVIANGNVELMRGKRVLLADSLYYYQNDDVVTASGNVSLMQPDGNVLFADNLKLENEFKTGVITEFKARLSDNSAFAAAQAQRVDEDTIRLDKAVYSPCDVCETSQEPLWQIKADTVTIDEMEQEIRYEDAMFEIWGTPIAYTPYFSHPTPDADRKSGFLRPVYGQNTNLGFNVMTPYYWNIAPDKDATITPWFTAKEGPVLMGEYRQQTDHGNYQFSGSATFPSKRDNATGDIVAGNEFRGHIFASGQDKLSEHWDWGFDLNRTSDDTYLRRYRFGFFDTLISRGYTERIEDRDYAIIEGLAFQGLEENDNPDREPIVLPTATVHVESDPLPWGAKATFDANALSLTRNVGARSRRLSTQTNLLLPHVTPGGHVLEAEAGLRVDVYNQSDVQLSSGGEFSGTQERVVPHASLKWRYPLLTQINNTSITVEPMAQIVASTRGHNSENISNEDSLTPEFTDLNLFSRNRYAGLDRIEEGTRAIYGVRAHTTIDGDNVSALIGQNIQLDGTNVFPLSNDPSRDYSDIVGYFGYDGENVNLDYGYRLDTDEVELRRSEVRGMYDYGHGVVTADYIRIQDDAVLDDRNELTGSASVIFNDNITLNAFGRRDLLRDDMIIAGGGAVINYDCVTFFPAVTREFTRDRDFEPDTSITLRVGLQGIN